MDPDTELETENTIREGFLSDFYTIKAIYAEFFDDNLNLNVSVASSLVGQSQTPQTRLPLLQIPKFGGDYKHFVPFLDLYNALVHNNVSLSPIEKFNYLVSVLEGQPLALIRTLPLTAANYVTAYDTLVKRYLNSRLRAQSHWQALENTQKINPENPAALRNLLDTFSENLSALTTLNFPVDSWDFVLVMMLLKRLDSSIITKFELEHGSSEVPKYCDLITFLEKICIAFEALD